MATFSVKFLGCKVSQSDLMTARRQMLEAGHTEVTEENAEIHVINTCCITREAEAKSRQAVRKSLKKSGGRSHVYVSGCAANLNASQFDTISPSVTALRGNSDQVVAKLPTVIGLYAGNSCEKSVFLRQKAEESNGFGYELGEIRTRGFVKIQDGCDTNCSYCIIPKVRGAARSRDAGAILDEVSERVRQGQPEIVITGISVGGYLDKERGWDLGRLMREVVHLNGVQRVRLSSVEVTDVNDSLIEAFYDEPKICPHMHLPMQSGDDRVLGAMGRNYSSKKYLETVENIRQRIPALNITTDVIVGFPGEDEEAFERTCECVDQAQITKVHTFSFSTRPGTEAEKLQDSSSPTVKKIRSKKMRDHSEELGRRYRSAVLGSEKMVLIDKLANSRASGYTDDYTRVYVDPERMERGKLVSVKLEELYADGAWGRVKE